MNIQDIINIIHGLQVQNTDEEPIPIIYVPYLYLNEHDITATRPDITVNNFIEKTTRTYAVPNTAYPVIYHGLKLKDTTDLNVNQMPNVVVLDLTEENIDFSVNSQKLEIFINIPYENGNDIGIHSYSLNDILEYILENALEDDLNAVLEYMLELVLNRIMFNIYTGWVSKSDDEHVVHVVDVLNNIEPYDYIRNSINSNYIILDDINTIYLDSLVGDHEEPYNIIEHGGKPKRKQIKKRKQKTHKKRKKTLKKYSIK
jgi:hypothetical protein|tara:strand:- start:205 stop:978 length:774 start_codon:yes stop_codon:yes gene_type:complete